jgi:hypothetical protein
MVIVVSAMEGHRRLLALASAITSIPIWEMDTLSRPENG